VTDGGLLLDTCAVIWVFGGVGIDKAARAAVAEAAAEGRLHLSPISAWEIGMLVAKGRIALSLPTARWIERAFGYPGARIAALEPGLLVESSFLPESPPGDPADRIVIATARANGLRIVTRDRAILGYAGRGHVAAMAC
jgi:PIN domain nuclease of toxin-antitoxin system